LRQLETYDGISCSQDHLLAMRRISYTFRYVQEVIYLEGTIPLCSSLERNSSSAPFPAPQRVTKDGFRAWLTSHNDLGLTRAMVGLGTRRYIVITDPLSFIDVLSYGPWPINIALVGTNSGRVIASNRTLDPEMLKQIDLHTPLKGLSAAKRGIRYRCPNWG
jgi:sensor c-di-GMP phosphodiesterase-like protein